VYVIPDNVVGIVAELRDGSTTNPGSILGNKRFSVLKSFKIDSGTQPGGCFLSGKVTGT
jgi:hypothetical protein